MHRIEESDADRTDATGVSFEGAGWVDAAMDAVLAVDAEARLVALNPAAARLFGSDAKDARGAPLARFFADEDRSSLAAALVAAANSGTSSPVALTVRRVDGTPVPVEATVARGAAPTNGVLTAFLRDLRTRRRLQQLNRLYAVLSGINTLIVRATHRDELFAHACRIIVETGGFTRAWIGLVGEGVEPVRIMSWAGDDDAFFADLQQRLAGRAGHSTGLLEHVLATGVPALSNDVARDPTVREREKLVQAGTRALALLPLEEDGRILGVVSIHSPVAGFFDDAEMRLLEELTRDIVFALDHFAKADRLRYLATHDALTGLANRHLFAERLARQLRETGDARVGIALLDIVGLRRVNETLGHAAGDELMRQVANRLRTTDEGAGRIGSDRFAFRLGSGNSAARFAHDVDAVLDRCCTAPFFIDGRELRVGCRIGIAIHPDDAGDAEALLQNAEAALREAKAKAQRFEFYSPAMNASAAEALDIESRLRRAIERDEFVLHYQPKVRLRDRRVCGLEALIRWNDPERGLVMPMRFIPVLEETGLIAAVGRWALAQALADRRAWIDAGLPAVKVAVNVSPRQLHQGDFVEQVALPDADGGLELEITESAIMDDVERNTALLHAVRDRGVGIAIDDFGTGYSSLSHIARLPLTALKIDRAFIAEMADTPTGYAMVSSIIAMAHVLELHVVAEGVETDEQARLLTLLNCDEAQGYLFSRPVPAAAVPALLTAPLPLPRD